MGAWGTGPLENDAAGDLFHELAQARQEDLPALLTSVFRRVTTADGVIDSWETEQALAGAVLVAYHLALQRERPFEVHEDLDLVRLEVTEELRRLAEKVVRRALVPEQNEWYQLWTLSEGIDEAKAELERYPSVLAH
ncbi:DUF4259 domain-containing protein [[Actinomadura] parvosata]|uniref:DUF4259 domain-containing protein n=1 Tax=[Actinomadura] parvosata TaxID=1955412 RepID=UPI00406D4A72